MVSLTLVNLPIPWPKKNPKIMRKVLFKISGTNIFTNGVRAIKNAININNVPIMAVITGASFGKYFDFLFLLSVDVSGIAENFCRSE